MYCSALYCTAHTCVLGDSTLSNDLRSGEEYAPYNGETGGKVERREGRRRKGGREWYRHTINSDREKKISNLLSSIVAMGFQ